MIDLNSDQKTLTLKGITSDPSETLPLRRTGFEEDKEFIQFIKNVERLVRSSNEYREWVKYIKDVLGFSACAVTQEKGCELTIEAHHHPISLFNICKAIIVKYMNEGKEFCTYDIALECMNLHFSNQVGFVILITSIHEKFHNGFIKIPIELCHGNFVHILNTYPFDDVDRQIILEYINVKLQDVKEVWTRNQYPVAVNG